MERKSKIALVIIGIVYVASLIAGIVTAKKTARNKYLSGYADGARDMAVLKDDEYDLIEID